MTSWRTAALASEDAVAAAVLLLSHAMREISAPLQPLAGRLVSLDVFRGLTMAAMVIVNNPGDWNHTYWPLLHAEWNGWTPTDLVFPFFLFMVGVSITLSRSTMGSWWRIVRRGVTIIGRSRCRT
jgi:predicted acyltransferase